jgi:hypothetical protein
MNGSQSRSKPPEELSERERAPRGRNEALISARYPRLPGGALH